MMTTSATLQQPTFVQMPPQPTTGVNRGHPTSSIMVSTTSAAQGQGVVRAPGTQNNPRETNKGTIFRLGIGEIVMGVLSVLMTMISLVISQHAVKSFWREYVARRNNYVYNSYGYNSHNYNNDYDSNRPVIVTGFTNSSPGIWGGIFVIITGILAVCIKSKPSRCLYIANMTMAIVTACITLSSTIISGFAAARSFYSSALIVLHATIMLLNFVSGIITIIHAAFCCRGVCCKKKSRLTQPVMYIPTQPNVVHPPQPQYVQAPNGQVMLAYVQQAPAQGYPQSNTPVQLFNQPQQANSPPPQQVYGEPPQMTQPPSYNNSNVNTAGMEAKSHDRS